MKSITKLLKKENSLILNKLQFPLLKFSKINNKNFSSVEFKTYLPKYVFTNQLKLVNTNQESFPIFRVSNENGEIINKEYENLDKETALKIHENMIKIGEFDKHFNSAQRLNMISFYMTCNGEEAAVLGSISALSPEDSIYPQYREAAALLYRGFTSEEMTNQLTGNYKDLGKGRQMPVHYGSKKLNYQTVSSPLATQIPQAAGAGYLFSSRNEKKVCLTYFGEGAASEGDFHAGLNFAATLNCQTIFFCRNNKYAISTSFHNQYKGDGIASRGPGYGIHTIRVDGNDVFAVYNATKEARKFSLENKKPVLIEAMTFRGGDHSTSDSSSNYRTKEIMEGWSDYLKMLGNPVKRLENYLISKNWISEEKIKEMQGSFRKEAIKSLKIAVETKKASVDSMFDDTYDFIPENLQEQKQELKNHLKEYGSNYNLDEYHV